ncbi:MAG: hypothetical protein IKP31_04650 [Lachnospiraceae bacterium]|nr:hypothetical protein [Lachnospiraceae bacterium]
MLEFVRKNIFAIIFSFMVLAMFTGYLFAKGGEFSSTENRYLARRPEITLSGILDGSFMKSFELYTEEQLPLRDTLVRLKAISGELMLKNENNGIARGDRGYLFEKLVSTSGQLGKNKAAIRNFAGQTDRDISLCIVPNSYEILSRDTPAGFPNVSQKAEIDDFYSELSSYGNVSTVSVYETLKENSEKYIYYRTDHHWTTQGAYLGYCRLCEAMGLTPWKEPENLESDRLRTVDGFYGTYHSKYRGMLGGFPDTLSYYDIPVISYETGGNTYHDLYDLDKLDTYDKYAMFMYGNEGMSIVESERGGAAKKRSELIIFKDSYANCLIPFFTYNYDRLIVIDLRYYPESVNELLDKNKDADILLIYNFMHFNDDNHFYRLTS